MKLRRLEEKDAPLMLEWMHDEAVVRDMRTDFARKTLEDCISFIRASADTAKHLHLAIADDNDEYMGTVSLKNIADGAAEFGITVRRCAMGRGFSFFGMRRVLAMGFEELGLERIYWCVSRNNTRACRFYDKHGFPEETESSPEILARYRETKDLKWYSVRREAFSA